MSLLITLGTLSLGSGADSDGNAWKWRELEGWDSPDLRATMLDLPGHDRQSFGPIHYQARALSLQGNCTCPTIAAYWLAKAKLVAATDHTDASGTLTVAETTPKQIAVRRGGRLLMKPWEGMGGFDFDIPLLAEDPRILAVTPTTITPPGTATNNGNFRAAALLTVLGPAAGPIVISNTVSGVLRTITVSTAIPSGQSLVIDFKARSVLLNGVNRYDLVTTTPQWWNVQPGANTIAYSGGGTPTLTWQNSWI